MYKYVNLNKDNGKVFGKPHDSPEDALEHLRRSLCVANNHRPVINLKEQIAKYQLCKIVEIGEWHDLYDKVEKTD